MFFCQYVDDAAVYLTDGASQIWCLNQPYICDQWAAEVGFKQIFSGFSRPHLGERITHIKFPFTYN